MPPQFFKDAHTGLGNKFVPRGFAFSIGANAANQGASTANTSVDSTETTDASELLPQASSTAPSTAGSSHFFHKVKHSKECDHLGGKGSNQAISHQHSLHTDGQPPNTCISAETAQNDPSLHSVESLATENSQDTSQRATSAADGQDEDDDVQITDIRELSIAIQPSHDDSELQCDDANSNETSSDLLLEALFKSQKLCSALKEKLEMANTKIHNQTDELQTQKNSVDKMRDTFKTFKNYLSELEARSIELRESRVADNRGISDLKKEYQYTVQRVQEYKQHILNFQQKVDHLKQIKLASNYEVEKRNKEIKALKVQLDDTQGLLSEQKIRTVQLEKILESSRKDYDKKIEDILVNSEKLKETLISTIGENTKLIDTSLGGKIECVTPALSKLGESIGHKVDALSERFLSALKITDGGITAGFANTTTELSQLFKNSMDNTKSGVLAETAQLSMQQLSIGDSLNKLLKSSELIMEESKTGSTGALEFYKQVIESVARLDEDIKDQNRTIASVNELRTNNEVLKAQCETLTKSLDSRADEVVKLQQEIKASAEQIRMAGLAKDELSDELKKIQSQLESKSSALKTSEEKANKCKSSCDSKLRTQTELYKMVTQEVEKIRKELEESRSKVSALENELTSKHNIDLEFKNVQKTNTKTIAEKNKVIATLESEKGDLKRELDQLKADFEQYKIDTAMNDLTVVVTPKKTVFGGAPNPRVTTPASKTINGNNANEKNTQKPPRASQKKITRPLHKRKLLDDDNDEKLIFDDFELDDVLLDNVPLIPKRYTKRKKTKQY